MSRINVAYRKDTMVYMRKVNFDSKNASQMTRKQITYFRYYMYLGLLQNVLPC